MLVKLVSTNMSGAARFIGQIGHLNTQGETFQFCMKDGSFFAGNIANFQFIRDGISITTKSGYCEFEAI